MNEGTKGEIPQKARIIRELTFLPGHLSHFFKSNINLRIFL